MFLFVLVYFLLQDILVAKAAQESYRCRSAYKLIELDDKYHFLKRGAVIVRALGKECC